MGNCVFKGPGVEVEEMVKVVTANGGVMQLYAPITAESITNEFPGHAIYRSRDLFSPPLLHNEHLHVGQLYYLLPLSQDMTSTTPSKLTNATAPNYRMSFDQNSCGYSSDHNQRAVFPRYSSRGVWKVKLVISPEQLGEILAQEEATQELIDSVRTVAKCGNSVSGFSNYNSSYAASSAGDSDQWSTVSGGGWKLQGLSAD